MVLRSFLFSVQESYRFLISTCHFAHLDGLSADYRFLISTCHFAHPGGLSAENLIPDFLSSAIYL